MLFALQLAATSTSHHTMTMLEAILLNDVDPGGPSQSLLFLILTSYHE
jgi:hypothetical protein